MRIAAAIAVYCVLLWLMRPLGAIGIIAALVSGTSSAAILFLARRKDILPLWRICFGAFIGVVLGSLPCAGSNVRQDCEISNMTFFAIIGMLIAMSVSAFQRQAASSEQSDRSDIH